MNTICHQPKIWTNKSHRQFLTNRQIELAFMLPKHNQTLKCYYYNRSIDWFIRSEAVDSVQGNHGVAIEIRW